MVASFCCWWHCRVDEQILLWSNYRQILWGKSRSKHIYYALSFWNSRFMKSLVASFQYLLSSCVKNVVIGNDEHDSSTLNEDCWHSTCGNICPCDQALFPNFGRGLGRRLRTCIGCHFRVPSFISGCPPQRFSVEKFYSPVTFWDLNTTRRLLYFLS